MESVLTDRVNRRERMENYRVSSHFSMEFPRQEYLKNIGEAQNTIDIVCGEFDPIVYNTPDFIEKVKHFLTYDGSLNVIFNGKSNGKEQAVKRIKSSNYNFMYMLSRLENSVQKNVHFFWCPRRPISHYAITDDSTLMVEEVHEVGKPRDIYCFKENTPAVEPFKKRFLELQSYCKHVETSKLVQGIGKTKQERIFHDLQELIQDKD